MAQDDTYDRLLTLNGIFSLKETELPELKEMIEKSNLQVFEDKQAWSNLISYVEKRFKQIVDQHKHLKEIEHLSI